jgi:hypothetical protein
VRLAEPLEGRSAEGGETRARSRSWFKKPQLSNTRSTRLGNELVYSHLETESALGAAKMLGPFRSLAPPVLGPDIVMEDFMDA